MIIEKENKFKSIPMGLDIIITVESVNYKTNELSVSWFSKEGYKNEDIWNLEHSIWAFERGEYIKIGINVFEIRTKHNQLENDGAYADDDL
jgi:hypothetical protein